MRQRRRMIIVAILAIVVIAGTLFVYISYRRHRRAAYRRLDEIERQSASTKCGKTEYAIRGEGYPILLVHGAAGGFDQGLALGADHVAPGFSLIAPSRFGYLGTPLPEEATPQSQADAFVCLLDELGIEEVAVMAYSAGGSAATQLALRHPDRVSALALVSTALTDKPLSLPPRPVVRAMLNSDFVFWLLANPLRPLAQRMFVPGDLELAPEEEAQVAETMQGLLPIKPRAQGLLFDIFVTNTDPHKRSSEYRLEEITVPTLVVNARNDPAANYEDALAMSRRIPQAQLVTVETGGHMMLGNGDRVRRKINGFLNENAR